MSRFVAMFAIRRNEPTAEGEPARPRAGTSVALRYAKSTTPPMSTMSAFVRFCPRSAKKRTLFAADFSIFLSNFVNSNAKPGATGGQKEVIGR